MFSGAEEAIFAVANDRARAGRPRDRRVARVPEPARGRAGGRRRRDPPRAARLGRLGDRRRPAAAPGDAAHAPDRGQRPAQPDRLPARTPRRTGPSPTSRPRPAPRSCPTRCTGSSSSTRPPAARGRRRRPARRLRRRDVEVVRAGRAADRVAGDATTRACSTATARFKDYTTICASAPAEILALIALRARDRVLARSQAIVEANLRHLDGFFDRQAAQFRWVRPAGGSIGFPELLAPTPIERFTDDLLEAEGVLLAPGSIFGHPGNHFRLGFGRTRPAGRARAASRRTRRARWADRGHLDLLHPSAARRLRRDDDRGRGRGAGAATGRGSSGCSTRVASCSSGRRSGASTPGCACSRRPTRPRRRAFMNEDPAIAEGFARGRAAADPGLAAARARRGEDPRRARGSGCRATRRPRGPSGPRAGGRTGRGTGR